MNKCNNTCNDEDQAITNYRYSALGIIVLTYMLYSIVTVSFG
jgi:hypothetical protein